jgi:hypothetical protein
LLRSRDSAHSIGSIGCLCFLASNYLGHVLTLALFFAPEFGQATRKGKKQHPNF